MYTYTSSVHTPPLGSSAVHPGIDCCREGEACGLVMEEGKQEQKHNGCHSTHVTDQQRKLLPAEIPFPTGAGPRLSPADTLPWSHSIGPELWCFALRNFLLLSVSGSLQEAQEATGMGLSLHGKKDGCFQKESGSCNPQGNRHISVLAHRFQNSCKGLIKQTEGRSSDRGGSWAQKVG